MARNSTTTAVLVGAAGVAGYWLSMRQADAPKQLRRLESFKEDERRASDSIQSNYGPVPAQAKANAMRHMRDTWYLSKEEMIKIMGDFQKEMRKGLTTDGGSSMKMYPTFVCALPTGRESGDYYALDLGGTNFRVIRVTLKKGAKPQLTSKKFKIDTARMTGTATLLFDFIADCVAEFFEQYPPADCGEKASLGFTFSFPVTQEGIAKGTLVRWTKGFSAKGVEGEDVVDLLNDAFERKGISINTSALINDTTGTLLACAQDKKDCVMGVILGTGSNAAYVERMRSIGPKFDRTGIHSDMMLINTEWGAFDDAKQILPVNVFDDLIDANSINVSQQIFEKMISGMYLGEMTRLAIKHMINSAGLFNGQLSMPFNRTWGFETQHMSAIEIDKTHDLREVDKVLKQKLGISGSCLEDRKILQEMCRLVSTRAARLAAIGIGAILNKIGRTDPDTTATVGIDGSVFSLYPFFQERMEEALELLFGEEIANNIKLVGASDGSGIGAALAAAIAEDTLCETSEEE